MLAESQYGKINFGHLQKRFRPKITRKTPKDREPLCLSMGSIWSNVYLCNVIKAVVLAIQNSYSCWFAESYISCLDHIQYIAHVSVSLVYFKCGSFQTLFILTLGTWILQSWLTQWIHWGCWDFAILSHHFLYQSYEYDHKISYISNRMVPEIKWLNNLRHIHFQALK